MQTNLDILLGLLLNREQMLLFKHQHVRASVLNQAASSSSEDEGESSQTTPYQEEVCSFNKLLGYQVGSELDHKLISGMFRREVSKRKQRT